MGRMEWEQKRNKEETSQLDGQAYLGDGGGVGGNSRPEVGALLGDGSGDGGALHLSLVVDDDAGVVLEVDEGAVLASVGLALADDDGGHDLLPELGLSLLHGGHEHVPDGGCWEAVQAPADPVDGDHEEILGPRVVRAVHDGADGETQGDAELAAAAATATSLGHLRRSLLSSPSWTWKW